MPAKVSVPTFDAMMWPALTALKAKGGSASNQELLDEVAKIMALTDEQMKMAHGDTLETEVAYRLGWAKTYLKKVGAVERSRRGVGSITPAGHRLTEKAVAGIPAQVRSEYARSKSSGVEPEHEDEDDWKHGLLKLLKAMSPDSFERLAQRILRESGFVKVEVTGRSGDGGIDGIGVLRMSLVSFQVFFRYKRYKSTVGAPAIRDFRGAMAGRTDKGLFITTGRFTPDAEKEATRDGTPPVELIDGDRLCDLLKELKLGVRTEQVEQVALVPEFFDGV